MTEQVAELVRGLRARNPASLGRAITLLERGDARASQLRDALRRDLPTARVIGITGPPGAGKSTLVGALVPALRARSRTVAVVAVDPASRRTGGAWLGDRARMKGTPGDDVYIRSVSSRGTLGGLAPCVPAVLDLLEGAGFDDIIVETVGVGQSEADVAALVDTTVVVVPPRAGDDNQASKAGLLEGADVVAVTKGDDPEAGVMARHLKSMHRRSAGTAAGWRVPVVVTTALRSDVAGLLQALDAHHARLTTTSELRSRRGERDVQELTMRLDHALLSRTHEARPAFRAWTTARTEDERLAAAEALWAGLVRSLEEALASCIQDTESGNLPV